MQRSIRLLVSLASISLGLADCATNKDAVLPTDGPSMKAIYDSHSEQMGTGETTAVRVELARRPVDADNASLQGFSRDATNELDITFPRLPNPVLVMFIFPHLATEERVPVPGYSTTFPMYERIEYALPGEVPGL